MGLQESGWLMDGVRMLFGFLDNVVYSLIKWILFGIFDLASLSTNSDVFSGIYSRIYVILGIFMAFKLSFSFFKYIIDPESMVGKSDTSLSKLFTRTFIMLAVLIFLPTVLFGQNGQEGLLARAQRAFLPSLPRVIFGVNNIGGISSSGNNNNSQEFTDSIEQSANDIAVTTLGGFFSPPDQLDEACGDGTLEKTPPIKSLDEFMANLKITCNKKGDIQIPLITGTKFYKYSYMWFISTVVGVLIAGLLLGVTLGIAKRVFKLMVLEVMAPIPIMSLIDPKGSKDGAFGKWSKSLISTFFDIFMKLGLVYMIMIFIHLIVNSEEGLFSNFPKNSGFRGTYLTILLILGLIFFAKEAPKFIKESLGFKGDGGGLFDDVKSVGKAAGLVAGSAVATAGTVGAFATNYRAAHDENELAHGGQGVRNFFRNVGSGLGGAIGHQAVTTKALMGKNGGVKAVMEASAKRNARRASGSTWLGRRKSEIMGVTTGDTPATKLGREISNMEEKQKLLKSIKARASSEMVKSAESKGKFGAISGTYNYKSVKAAYDAASAAGKTKFVIKDAVTGHSKTITTQEAAYNIGALLKSNEEDYIANAATSYTKKDEVLARYQTEADARGYIDGSGASIAYDRGKIGDTIDEIDNELYEKKRKYSVAQANDSFSKK